MTLLQPFNESLVSTFKDIGLLIKYHLKQLMTGKLPIGAIVLVFDSYDNALSIKNTERQQSGEEQRARYAISENSQVLNYRKFIKNSGYKAALAKFVLDYLIASKHNLLEDLMMVKLSSL